MQYATAYAFRAAMNLAVCCYHKRSELNGLTNAMLKWIWCGSEAGYDHFYLCNVIVKADYFCKILIETAQQRCIY